jgi:glycosyltransferase involved in cell wall biosynthesis
MFGADIKRSLAEALSAGYDILHLEQHWSGWLCLRHTERALLNVHYLMGIDLGETRPKTAAEWQNWLLGFSAERRLIRSFPRFRACTPRLESALRAISPSANVTTIPFALDTTLYDYIPDDRRTTAPTVSLIGSMHWPPSLSAARRLLTRLWPEIKRRVPAARLQVVGWQARSALGEFLGMEDVSVLENVPETRPHFEAASVFVYAPGRGSGMKIKIQEAMAYGVPVVTTSEGVEGLPAEDGIHACVCDDDGGLIDRTVRLLGDVGLQNRQRLAARRLIETHCAPAATLDALEKLYARMMASDRATDGA